MPNKPLLIVDLPSLRLFSRGKCRDTFVLDNETRHPKNRNVWLLMAATDRISAFDFILPTGIPDKGKILTQMSLFWFEKVLPICPTHMVTSDPDFLLKAYVNQKDAELNDLYGRCLVIQKANVLPFECIARMHLTGSAWESYRESGQVCGIKLPPNLKEADRLPAPIFTPSTKAAAGQHDVNITFDTMVEELGGAVADALRDLTLKIFQAAYDYAWSRGVIIADTKMEFGKRKGKIIVIDELLTPDSSRFWPRDGFEPGKSQPSFDKQYARDWLTNSGWDKRSPAPVLPEDVVKETQRKYIEAFERLTGRNWRSN